MPELPEAPKQASRSFAMPVAFSRRGVTLLRILRRNSRCHVCRRARRPRLSSESSRLQGQSLYVPVTSNRALHIAETLWRESPTSMRHVSERLPAVMEQTARVAACYTTCPLTGDASRLHPAHRKVCGVPLPFRVSPCLRSNSYYHAMVHTSKPTPCNPQSIKTSRTLMTRAAPYKTALPIYHLHQNDPHIFLYQLL